MLSAHRGTVDQHNPIAMEQEDTLMQIVRVFSGEDGESHFEDLTTDQLTVLVSRVGDGPVNLQCRKKNPWRRPPCRRMAPPLSRQGRRRYSMN